MDDRPVPMHPEDIKAMVRKRGISLAEVARRAGVSPQSVALACKRPIAEGERAILAFLGVPGQKIWPDRYDATGMRIVRQGVRPHSVSKNTISPARGHAAKSGRTASPTPKVVDAA